jgi:phage tail-like protein
MATINNNRATLVTDPLRNFRFLVTFTPIASSATSSLPNSSAVTALSKVTFGFTSVSGMAVTTDSIPYREGGYNTTVHQIPGQTTFQPITLQRGVILGTSQNWDWMRNLFATVQGSTGGSTLTAGQNFRCDLEIDVLQHPIPSGATSLSDVGTPTNGSTPAASTDVVAQRFYVYNAWPTSISYSDLNAGDNALLVEQLTLVHEGIDISWGQTYGTTAPQLGDTTATL